ncbi:MAG: 1-deoxy-D-xylulose-5-phosphate synthase [Bacteroidales bacterium]|nr:1-deoxy-D-xylulose-5-phosphate synthase [Bacteroidales bacterium]
MYQLLDKIDSPADIRKLSIEELPKLCSEIRKYMVDCCSRNPGHLASSLGTVEMIVATHYVFDTPEDKLVFDVGHQAYAHKIVTGRREAFEHNRTKDGISGFPNRDESPYDVFGTGHSSTSISAALGLAEAAKMQGQNHKVIAMIGDGALTGGLALEGINNAGASKADLLVLLNDNNQSIDQNKGAVHDYLLSLTTSAAYNRLKKQVWDSMGEGKARKRLQRFVVSAKSLAVKRSGGDLFEALGFRYFGPVDGNDVVQMVDALRRLKALDGPRVLHCLTVKGKGYAPAEQDPATWHAPGRFDPETGERIHNSHPADRYQDVFGQTLLELARKDSRVVGITPAMAKGCGMCILAKEMPERFFDVGIEEEHAVTFSAGLAAGGMKPFCNIYSAFSQRAYDQIIHDVALQHLPVVLCFDRAGLVGEDGATHQGAFDMSAYRSIPDTVIAVPADELELRRAMYTGWQQDSGPFIIRYPRGMGQGVEWKTAQPDILPVGKGQRLAEGSGIAILAIGPMAYMAQEAAAKILKEDGKACSVYNMRYLKPLDEEILEEACAGCRGIVTVEDGSLKGGLFGAVSEWVAQRGLGTVVQGIGIPDRFIAQATQSQQRNDCGLSVEGIVSACRIMSKKI